MRFRKKPVEIEAMHWDGSPKSATDIGCWASQHGTTVCADMEGGRPLRLLIPTLEGQMFAQAGDWIIRGVAGEFYPCKPDIFVTTYEPATDKTAAPHCEGEANQ